MSPARKAQVGRLHPRRVYQEELTRHGLSIQILAFCPETEIIPFEAFDRPVMSWYTGNTKDVQIKNRLGHF